MILISGPYSSLDIEEKNFRIKATGKACVKLLSDGKIAISPLLYGLAVIEKSGEKLPDTYEFWQEFCRSFVRTADTMYVLNLPGWDTSTGVADEIDEARKINIPIYLVHFDTLEFVRVL